MGDEEKKKITRRKYLKYTGGVVVGAAAAAAGYGIYESTKPLPPTPTQTATSTVPVTTTVPTVTAPTDLSTIIFTFSADPGSWDPQVTADDSIFRQSAVYEPLTYLAPDGTPQPFLAESWDVSKDGLEFVFHIRDDIKFHDGTKFDGAAAKWNFDRLLKINKGLAHLLTDVVDKVDTAGSQTVNFTLKYPVALDAMLGAKATLRMISPTYAQAHEVSGDLGQAYLLDHTCGTGPYELDSWVPGQQTTFTKFDDYWRGWSGKHASRVVVRLIREAATMELSIRKGDIDMAFSETLPPEVIRELAKDPNIVVKTTPGIDVGWTPMNVKKPPTDNVLVRKAIAYSWPYKEVVEDIYKDQTSYADSPIAQNLWGHNPNLTKYATDLNQAKALLAQAGYSKGGLTASVFYWLGDDRIQRAMELFRSNLKEVGITLDTRSMPWDEMVRLIENLDTAPNMAPYSYGPPYGYTGDSIEYPLGSANLPSKGGMNWAYYENPVLDDLLARAKRLSATDREKCKELLYEAQRIVVDQDCVMFYRAVFNYVQVYRSWLKGWTWNPMYYYSLDYYPCYKEWP